MILIGRSYEVVVGDLSLERKVLGGVSLELSPGTWNRIAYSEDICTFIAESFWVYTSLRCCTLNLSNISAFMEETRRE
jgi:hypothetical protein